MYTPTALPATGGVAFLGLSMLGHLWVGVTLVCIGAIVFGLIRLRLAEGK